MPSSRDSTTRRVVSRCVPRAPLLETLAAFLVASPRARDEIHGAIRRQLEGGLA